jgi:hypothetical protein
MIARAQTATGRKPRKRGPKSKATTFTSAKFRWLERLACDNRLPPLALRLCVVLTPFFNLDRNGTAWPLQGTLAAKLGASREAINRMIGVLIGYLETSRRGRDKSNLYRMALPEPAEKAADDVTERSHHKPHDVTVSSVRCDQTVTRTPFKTPGAF